MRSYGSTSGSTWAGSEPGRGLGEVAAMHVSDGIAAWHWWTLAELDATDEVVSPAGLAELIRRLSG